MAHAKSNLAPKGISHAFEITEEGEFRWAGVSPLGAEDLVAREARDDRPERARATEFLKVLLADGPVRADLISERAQAAGISESTLKRAKGELGVASKHVGGISGGGEWYWRLPDESKEARRPPGHVGEGGLLAPSDVGRSLDG